MQTLTAKPVEHIDHLGQKKYYVIISNGKDSYSLTSGVNTFNKLNEMANEAEKKEGKADTKK